MRNSVYLLLVTLFFSCAKDKGPTTTEDPFCQYRKSFGTLVSYTDAQQSLGPFYNIPEKTNFERRLGDMISFIEGLVLVGSIAPGEISVIVYQYQNECSRELAYQLVTAGKGKGLPIADISFAALDSLINTTIDLEGERLFRQDGFGFDVSDQGW